MARRSEFPGFGGDRTSFEMRPIPFPVILRSALDASGNFGIFTHSFEADGPMT